MSTAGPETTQRTNCQNKEGVNVTFEQIFFGIIFLGILVFVHELGHFLVAKANNVKVLKFSLGFGPKLISKRWGDTEYLICAIPLGGYVQMLGEGKGEEGEDALLTEEEKERSFALKSVGQRTAIIAAGPIMNLLLPFLILPVAYMVGVDMPAFLDEKACVGYVLNDSEGSKSGFQSGDCIVALGEETIENWADVNKALISLVGNPLAFTVERQGEIIGLDMNPENGGLEGLQSLGLFPMQPATIGALSPGMPAKAAGMLVGDRIVAIDGVPVTSWYDLRVFIQNGEGRSQKFTVERESLLVDIELVPKKKKVEDDYLIGIAPDQPAVFKRFGLVESIRYGAKKTVDLIELTVVFIQKLFSGHVSTKNIGGPIMVVQIAGQAAQTGIASSLTFLAFLSIQLGILNLLPIPILDGGHLMFNLAEFVVRRPLPHRLREVAQQVGLLMLLMLMVVAFYNDIVRIFFGGQ